MSGMVNRSLQLALVLMLTLLSASAALAAAETVFFPSSDGKTEIVGYLFRPQTPGPHPAIVLLHGRGGLYSTNVNKGCTLVSRGTSSPCNAGGLSKRHAMWAQYWAARGYIALLPDSFGPRGKARGFGRFTHDDPDRDDVNEKTVRPLDAEGALAWLRGQRDVVAGRIFLQGWSNGGSTALNVLQRQGTKQGFRGALAFYPGCGPKALLAQTLTTSAPITMLLGSNDEEVSPQRCQEFAQRSIAAGSKIDVTLYPGATHGFDDPDRKHQSVPGNAAATADVLKRAIAIVDALRD